MNRMVPVIGWKEWAALPDLNIPRLKVKMDTGARTSALHTYFIEPFVKDGKEMVRFGVHPLQKTDDPSIICEAQVIDKRRIKNTGGQKEVRYIISTNIKMGEKLFPLELSLANRDAMLFRMLVGRTALKGRFVIDPSKIHTLDAAG